MDRGIFLKVGCLSADISIKERYLPEVHFSESLRGERMMESWSILVVDDDQDIVRIIKLYLLNKGYNVLTAFSGQEGCEKAEAEKPDLIILDAMMPGMDGFQTIEKLQGNETTKDIPIIMCTAKSARGEVVRAAQLGVKNYVVKPFAGPVLLQKVREVLFPTEDSDAYSAQVDFRHRRE